MAVSHYYVDPSIAANSGTGIISDPYGDLQYALNQITRNSTDGDQINIKAGTAEIMTSSSGLTLATYGTPGRTAPLIFRGYTSAANDGGIGEIQGDGNKPIFDNNTYDYLHFIDLKVQYSGTTNYDNFDLGDYCIFYNCEISHSKTCLRLGENCQVIGCYLHNFTNYAVLAQAGTIVYRCDIDITDSCWAAVRASAAHVVGCNIFVDAGYTQGVLHAAAHGTMFADNTIYVDWAGVNPAIRFYVSGTAGASSVINNVIQGVSGAGGDGINAPKHTLVINNVAYNCTDNFDLDSDVLEDSNNVEATAAILVDPSSDDFRPIPGSDLVDAGYGGPENFGANYIDVGALQRKRPKPRWYRT